MDTDPNIDALYRQKLLALSPEERLRMACSMFDTAVALIESSLAPEVLADPVARKIALLRRLYPDERDREFIDWVVEQIRAGISPIESLHRQRLAHRNRQPG